MGYNCPMDLNAKILIFSTLFLFALAIVALYARRRMDVRITLMREEILRELDKTNADSQEQLSQQNVLIQDLTDNSASARASLELAMQLNMENSSIIEGVSKSLEHVLVEISRLNTVDIELARLTEVTKTSETSLVELQKQFSKINQLDRQLGDVVQSVGTLRGSIERVTSQLADSIQAQDSGFLDIETQLAVDRVADVEHIALTAARMAGDALVKMGVENPSLSKNVSHGHSMLMYQLLIDASKGDRVASSNSFHVLEIGTTREKWWPQMSTSRLAALCRALGYKMISVDVDELSSAAGAEASRFYGETIKVKTEAGEKFLQEWKGNLPPYIYIDAYDYVHDMHSAARQERYRTLQGGAINDEACWEMHFQCAVAFVEKCAVGGVVVFDDVFFKDDEWLGKGKTAVPYMLDKGFEIIAQTSKTVVFRKMNDDYSKSAI